MIFSIFRDTNVNLVIPIYRNHCIDQEGFHKHYFTPYAAYDPMSGIKLEIYDERKKVFVLLPKEQVQDYLEVFSGTSISDSSKIRLSIGCMQDGAMMQINKFALGEMLKRMFDGNFDGVDTYIATTAGPQYGINLLSFDLNTLKSSTLPNGRDALDFPRRVQYTYKLENEKIACTVSWCLVRAALLNRWDIVDDLIETTNRFRDLQYKKQKKADKSFLTEKLNQIIPQLKDMVLE